MNIFIPNMQEWLTNVIILNQFPFAISATDHLKFDSKKQIKLQNVQSLLLQVSRNLVSKLSSCIIPSAISAYVPRQQMDLILNDQLVQETIYKWNAEFDAQLRFVLCAE